MVLVPSDGGRKGNCCLSFSGDFFVNREREIKGEGREKGERNLEINSYFAGIVVQGN